MPASLLINTAVYRWMRLAKWGCRISHAVVVSEDRRVILCKLFAEFGHRGECELPLVGFCEVNKLGERYSTIGAFAVSRRFIF